MPWMYPFTVQNPSMETFGIPREPTAKIQILMVEQSAFILFMSQGCMYHLKHTFRNIFPGLWYCMHTAISDVNSSVTHCRLQRTNLFQHDERADHLHNKKHIEEWLDLHIWIWNWLCWFYKSILKCTCAVLWLCVLLRSICTQLRNSGEAGILAIKWIQLPLMQSRWKFS